MSNAFAIIRSSRFHALSAMIYLQIVLEKVLEVLESASNASVAYVTSKLLEICWKLFSNTFNKTATEFMTICWNVGNFFLHANKNMFVRCARQLHLQ